MVAAEQHERREAVRRFIRGMYDGGREEAATIHARVSRKYFRIMGYTTEMVEDEIISMVLEVEGKRRSEREVLWAEVLR